MLLLVAAHRHQVRLVEQDIRRHQGGIGEEAGVDVVGVFGGFILELGHAGELTEHGVAVQHPAQLGVGRHMGLDKEGILLRIQTAGNVGRHLGNGMAAQLRRHLAHRDGVHVCQHVVTIIFIRQSGPVADGPQVGAQGQITGGLDAAENAFFLHFIFHSWNTSNLSIERALQNGAI